MPWLAKLTHVCSPRPKTLVFQLALSTQQAPIFQIYDSWLSHQAGVVQKALLVCHKSVCILTGALMGCGLNTPGATGGLEQRWWLIASWAGKCCRLVIGVCVSVLQQCNACMGQCQLHRLCAVAVSQSIPFSLLGHSIVGMLASMWIMLYSNPGQIFRIVRYWKAYCQLEFPLEFHVWPVFPSNVIS